MADVAGNRSDGLSLHEVIGQQESRISNLQDENAALRTQLTAWQDARASKDCSRLRPPSSTELITGDAQQALPPKYVDLASAYMQLLETHARCAPYIKKANEEYRAAKESARNWRAYLDSKRIADVRTTPKSSANSVRLPSDPDRTPRPVLTPATPANPTEGVRAKSVEREYVRPPGSSLNLPAYEERTRSSPVSRVFRVTSSQTTAAESDPKSSQSSPPTKFGIISDCEPVVISARSLKRKRSTSVRAMPPPSRIKQEPGVDAPIEIRSEDFSSPVSSQRRIVRTHTSDLDASTEKVRTPHRRRLAQVMEGRATSEELVRRPSLITRTSSLSDGDVEAQGSRFSHRIRGSKALTSVASTRDLGIGHKSHDLSSTALKPLSNNTVVSHREGRRSDSKRERRNRETANRIAFISEDGDGDGARLTSKVSAHKNGVTNSRREARLDGMLERPAPAMTELIRSQTPNSVPSKSMRPLTPVSLEAKRSAPSLQRSVLEQTVKKSAMSRPIGKGPTSVQRIKIEDDAPPPMRPEDEPLRLRHYTSLGLDDFKINPKYMGSEFAFADTLRGRDQRRCMQGCTKPDCCGGAFMKAIQMAGIVKSGKTDAEVLENFLGGNWQEIMGSYGRAKRDDLLLQAHASSFSNKFGKHKHAFERRSTPPGFWRIDMASTQEEMDDRAKALELEKQKIEERWREAMREGGRWLFRDE